MQRKRNRVIAVFTVTLAAAALAGSQRANAQDDSAPFANPPPASSAPMAALGTSFGTTGQWVASMRTAPGSGFLYFHNPSGPSWQIAIHPAVDYFLTSRISVGGVLGFTHSPDMVGTTTLDLGARAGFNLDINGTFGIWPTAGFAVQYASSNHVATTTSALQIFAPFLWHPVTHAFVGIGPEFQQGLTGGTGRGFGVDFIIGGWM